MLRLTPDLYSPYCNLLLILKADSRHASLWTKTCQDLCSRKWRCRSAHSPESRPQLSVKNFFLLSHTDTDSFSRDGRVISTVMIALVFFKVAVVFLQERDVSTANQNLPSHSNQLVIIIRLISTVKLIYGTSSLPGARMSKGVRVYVINLANGRVAWGYHGNRRSHRYLVSSGCVDAGSTWPENWSLCVAGCNSLSAPSVISGLCT